MPPPTESQSHLVMFFSWVWINIVQISAILGGAGLLFGGILTVGKRKKEYELMQSTVNTMNANQIRVIGLIPKESWAHGVMLLNANDCSRLRVDCRTRVLVEDLQGNQSILKEAVAYMIRHDDRIPEPKRDELFEKLLK